MEVIEVNWGKDLVTSNVAYNLWATAQCNTKVLGRVEAKYKPLSMKAKVSSVDVSTPVGLFQTESPITPEENERLERCLSDLLLWVIQPQLTNAPCVVLIKGPTLNKLIGRLAYRFPRAGFTIAFVTINAFAQQWNPTLSHRANDVDWDGPNPPFHVDNIVRTYFSSKEALRVDLFAQGLSRFPVNEEHDGIAYGVEAKLYQANDSIPKFAKTLRNSALSKTTAVSSSPARQRSLYPEEEESEEESGLPIAAKNTGLRYQGSYEKNQLSRPNTTSPQELTDEELFNAYSDQRTSTEIGMQRFEVWKKYIHGNDIHDLDDKRRFLIFVEETLKHNRYPKRFVYTLGNLTHWYGEYRQGEPHGAKR